MSASAAPAAAARPAPSESSWIASSSRCSAGWVPERRASARARGTAATRTSTADHGTRTGRHCIWRGEVLLFRHAVPPMTKREKFGKFVLLEEIDASGLGAEYRAAKLGPDGFEKIVTVLRLTPALSANAEAVKLLMEQVKLAAQLQNANIIKILGIGGRVGSPCWVSYEFFEGKSLKAI